MTMTCDHPVLDNRVSDAEWAGVFGASLAVLPSAFMAGGFDATHSYVRANLTKSDVETILDTAYDEAQERAPRGSLPVDRRGFLALVQAAALAFVMPTVMGANSAAAATASVHGSGAVGDLIAYLHAMHVHNSASEGIGSVHAQNNLASRLGGGGVTIWDTNHHDRAANLNRVLQYVFTSLSSISGWSWAARTAGSATLKKAETVALGSGDAAFGTRALLLAITSAAEASHGVQAVTDNLLEGNVEGRTINIPLKAEYFDGKSFFDVLTTYSLHLNLEGYSGQKVPGDGRLKVIHRYGNFAPRSELINKGLGIIYHPIKVGWNQVTIVPLDDLELFWGSDPMIDPRDNSITALDLSVGSTGGKISMLVPKIDLPRQFVGDEAIARHASVIADSVVQYTTIKHYPGLEFSQYKHLCAYGNSTPRLYDAASIEALAKILIGAMLVLCYNHPFGVGSGQKTDAEQSAALAKMAKQLMDARLYGAHLLEAAYLWRGGVSLKYHMELADILWAFGLFFAINGVTDDHNGKNWADGSFETVTRSEGGLVDQHLDAFRRGMLVVRQIGTYNGEVFVALNGNPMGTVAVDAATSGVNVLRVTATNLAAGWTVRVIQIPINRQRASRSPATLFKTLTAADMAAGSLEINVPKNASYAWRIEVRNASGAMVGASNPVWQLKAEIDPIPKERIPGMKIGA